MRMNPTISIIVPVYNAEKYLHKCLNSILNQELNNIEVIIIDDGSSDNSKKIIQEYQVKDSRVRAIYQSNQGVSATRNKGIRIAKGEYIGFVDADDYIELDMYKKMYQKAEEVKADIVVCNVRDIFHNNTRISLKLEEGLISVEDIKPKEFLKEKYFNLGTAVWHKIFRRSLIEESKIRFINYNEVSSEDTIFNLQAMLKAKTIYCIDKPLYNYIIRDDSLTKSNLAKENMVYRCGNLVNVIHKYCERNIIETGKYIEYITYWQLINSLSYVYPKNLKNLSLAIKEYSRNKLYKSALKKLVLSNSLDIYFINQKKQYSTLYKLFDKLFAFLCLINLNMLAALVHSVRIKRTELIQSKFI